MYLVAVTLPTSSSDRSLALNKMDRYWKITDHSNVYRIAMPVGTSILMLYIPVLIHSFVYTDTALHPGVKLKYFQAHNWEAEWVDAAENIVHKEWITWYKDQVITPNSDSSQGVIVNDICPLSVLCTVQILECSPDSRK